MTRHGSFFWKKIPFLKLLLPLITGIIMQWQFQVSSVIWWTAIVSGSVLLISLSFFPLSERFRLGFINGLLTAILFFSSGALRTWHKDPRNDRSWVGNHLKGAAAIVVVIDEPLIEKTRSFKANATIRFVAGNGKQISSAGNIILYFSKDSLPALSYGSVIIFKKTLQEIKASGNPGGFDYKRYALFHGITHQVFLQPDDFVVLKKKEVNLLQHVIFSSRDKLLSVLRQYIPGEKERGLAEALLIGYKQDLDQSLVQSYTNTGVVHIIAISGLHLGLIYWLLALLLRPLEKRKSTKWLRALLIITGLWVFSLLAGAQPSILRSAIMFTCIVFGESISRKTTVFNSMAVSAFIILCINPYWLWDVGFQLSYAAVLSILLFMKPIYNLFYIKNKLLDAIWKLNAVTLAAQVLTVPLSIYHFHQFPNFFILTNFLAVPLSSMILLGEIFLCVISFFPAVATVTGKIIAWLIRFMNVYIGRIEAIPFSLWNGLLISFFQMLLLFAFIITLAAWLQGRRVLFLHFSLFSLLCFAGLRSYSFIITGQQQKIIVYNVPKQQAIDVIEKHRYHFIGDSNLLQNEFARNFHLQPSRILYRAHYRDSSFGQKQIFIIRNRRILILDKSIETTGFNIKLPIDLLILSGNPKIYISRLARDFLIRQVVFDGTVPAWKSRYWKKDCDSLHIPWHDVSINGAFVMNLR